MTLLRESITFHSVTLQLYWGYWAFLILHAPEFWKWIVCPGIIFLLEQFGRLLQSFMGKGKTTISAGVILPSKVREGNLYNRILQDLPLIIRIVGRKFECNRVVRIRR